MSNVTVYCVIEIACIRVSTKEYAHILSQTARIFAKTYAPIVFLFVCKLEWDIRGNPSLYTQQFIQEMQH